MDLVPVGGTGSLMEEEAEEEEGDTLVRLREGSEDLCCDRGDEGIEEVLVVVEGLGLEMWDRAEVGGVVGAVGEWGEDGL
jgi:hypothetical protein